MCDVTRDSARFAQDCYPVGENCLSGVRRRQEGWLGGVNHSDGFELRSPNFTLLHRLPGGRSVKSGCWGGHGRGA